MTCRDIFGNFEITLTLDSIVGTICRTKVSTNEEEELDFNTKYRKYSSDNCFVNLDS